MPPEQATQLDRIERKLDWIHRAMKFAAIDGGGLWPGDLDGPWPWPSALNRSGGTPGEAAPADGPATTIAQLAARQRPHERPDLL